MREPDDLQAYQNEAVWFLIKQNYAALWLDMGLGKTISALSALAYLLLMGEVERVLIIAPLRVAASTWPNEIAGWTHTREIPWTLIRASGDAPEVTEARWTSRRATAALGFHPTAVTRIAERAVTLAEERVRLRLLRTDTPIHIISREMVPWLVKRWGKRWPYDLVIYDESSGLRDHKTERVKCLVYVRQFVKRFWQLTGTPAPESYLDLFPQVFLLDRGERFGSAITPFRETYFNHNQYSRKYTIKPGAADAIIDKLAPLVLVMKAEDYLPINDPVFVDKVVDLSPSELTTYDVLEQDMVASLPSGHEIVVETAGALHQKLLQYASGSVYGEEKSVHWVHDQKINALSDLIEEAQGQPIIVAYWFQPSLARLKKAFPQGRPMDKEGKLEAEWTDGKVPLMFLHPQSGGHGLNLQYGGHNLVFFDIPYSLELYLQTVGRIARQGQRFVPRVFHLIARGTIDAGIVPILRAKGDAQDYLFQRLRRLRREQQERLAA